MCDDEKEIIRIKKSLGQKLGNYKELWEVFAQAYLQCVEEGFEFPFGNETVEMWIRHKELEKPLMEDWDRDQRPNGIHYSFRSFRDFYCYKLNHPVKAFGRRLSFKYFQYLETQKRFWSLSEKIFNELVSKPKDGEISLNELYSIIEQIRERQHSELYFVKAAKEAYGKEINSLRYPYPLDKSFWDFAFEFEKTFNYSEIRKDYLKNYFQEHKQEIYKRRKSKGYAGDYRKNWTKASGKYRNKVCNYKGEYCSLDQLKRKVKDKEELKKYILSDSEQIRKCVYEGKVFEFWDLCRELKKRKIENPYETALKAIES